MSALPPKATSNATYECQLWATGAAAPNSPDLAGRQVALFLPLPGYDPRSIIAEAQGPLVYRELSGPPVFILDNEHYAVAFHRVTRPRRNRIKSRIEPEMARDESVFPEAFKPVRCQRANPINMA